MADKLKEIQVKVLEWWNKFTSKQKTIIVGITATVLFAFVLIIYIFNKPQYTRVFDCETTAEAAEIIEVLDAAGIAHKETTDGLHISVVTSQLSKANLELGAAGYPSKGTSLDDVLGGGFSATESDKQKRYVEHMRQLLITDMEAYSGVKSANVLMNVPDQDGTLLAQKEEASVYIRLELESDFKTENAANLAKAAATYMGNKTTANITIVDTNGNKLFDGTDDGTEAGIASNSMELRSQAEAMISGKVKKVLQGTGQFDMVEVAPQLDIDFSNYNRTVNEYSAPDGQDQGMLSHRDQLETETENGGIGGNPGTDSNDENGYVIQDGNGSSSSSTTEISEDFLPNQTMEQKITPAGGINFSNSSISIACIKLKIVHEEDVKAQGLLDGVSWDEYKAANGERTKLEVDPDFYSMISNATNISEDKITILVYEEPIFYDKEGINVKTTDVLSIAMLVIILALLAFVVLRNMRFKHEVAEEEELSVENLLQSTPDEELDNIELENKSDTRRMIEKFVDENPEASANLLRNWLNEDWG